MRLSLELKHGNQKRPFSSFQLSREDLRRKAIKAVMDSKKQVEDSRHTACEAPGFTHKKIIGSSYNSGYILPYYNGANS